MPAKEEFTQSLPERVVRLETTMTTLAGDMRETTNSIKNLANTINDGFEKINGDTNQKFEQLKRDNKIPLSGLGAIFGILLAVLGWFVHYTMSPNIIKTTILEAQVIEQSKKIESLEKTKEMLIRHDERFNILLKLP